ncbi:hypothetical protein ACOZ38_24690 [Sphaerisporangium viridialbum]|uniref:hypothetical protein n=1 Tax=Sphaerisporangium viridialbum TaxID=46189 RepID=UPI003C77DB90
MSPPLSPLASELARIVAGYRGKRIPVEELFNQASRFAPSLVGDAEGPARFRNALDELQDAGKLTLPAARSRTGWDSRIFPALPVWVIRVEPLPAPRPQLAQRVWPRALEAAGSVATRADEQQILDRIATWMRDDPSPEYVPVQERSLELFDDEKAIDGYMKTRLFTSGALTLDLLACFTPPLPFVSQHVPGNGPTTLLVLENRATYTSFLTALRDLQPGFRPDLHLGWGHGNGFSQSILSIPMLDPAPTAVYYFGDLDLAGLLTATNAAAQASAAGLPELRPASSCYQFLLDGPSRWRSSDRSNLHTGSDYDATCRWLPAALRQQGLDLLHARHRIPQERLGLKALRQHSELWTEFATAAPMPVHQQRTAHR